MKIHLRHKIIGLAIISALIPTLILVLFLEIREVPIKAAIVQEIDSLLKEHLKTMVDDAYTSFYMAGVTMDRQLESGISLVDYILDEKGDVSLSDKETVPWVAVNMLTNEKMTNTLPKFLIGSEWIAPNRVFSKPTPVIDKIGEVTGVSLTIFQRVNAIGDLLSIASNVPASNGDRNIGMLSPAYLSNGKPNPLTMAILRDQLYRETHYDAAGNLTVSLYKALKDKQEKIVGALCMEAEAEDFSSYLTESTKNLKVGTSGYVFAFKGIGVKIENALLIHSLNIPVSQILSSESIPIYEAIRRKVSTTDITNATVGNYSSMYVENYSWIDSGERKPSKKKIVYTYFAGWDLIIGVTAYERDFAKPFLLVGTTFVQLMLGVIIGGVIVMVIVGIIAWITGGIIANPITLITGIARKVAEGDLNSASAFIIDIESTNKQLAKARRSEDETGELFRAIILMIDNLNHLIGQVRRASVQLITTATNIDVTAKTQESTVSDFSTYTNQIAAAVKQISSTSQDLYKTITEVSEVATETGSMVDAGLGELSEMESTMQNLTEATTSISGKLSTITEKAKNITSVVTTISKVADQTNLLALNAAIEAEKAGEFGAGFSVIANEIKHLADQTGLATFDIEQMVKEMQSAVGAGVMEMDKFTEEVKGGVDEVGRISNRLEKIILQVQQLTPRFEIVKEGMQLQSQGAHQINDAMVNLAETANKTIEVLQEFEKATKSLHEAVDSLKGEVLKFKVLDGSPLIQAGSKPVDIHSPK